MGKMYATVRRFYRQIKISEEFCFLGYKVEYSVERQPPFRRVLLATCFTVVSCLAYSTLKMEATRSSETSVDFQRTTRHYIPEERTLYNHGVTCLFSFWNQSKLYPYSCIESTYCYIAVTQGLIAYSYIEVTRKFHAYSHVKLSLWCTLVLIFKSLWIILLFCNVEMITDFFIPRCYFQEIFYLL
jgi:hypothetical protein